MLIDNSSILFYKILTIYTESMALIWLNFNQIVGYIRFLLRRALLFIDKW